MQGNIVGYGGTIVKFKRNMQVYWNMMWFGLKL